MKKLIARLSLSLMLTVPIWASEDFKIPAGFDKLAERATDTVDVTLDASLLQLASGFLSKDDPDEAKVKKLVSKMRGIYVRSFEFDKEGQYSKSDVEALRLTLKTPAWSRIVSVKSNKGENSEIYLKREGEKIAGLVVIDAEPKELTLVHIDGPIDPEELGELEGHLGIPKLDKAGSRKSGKDEE